MGLALAGPDDGDVGTDSVVCSSFIPPMWVMTDHVGGDEKQAPAAPHLSHDPRWTRPSAFSKDGF